MPSRPSQLPSPTVIANDRATLTALRDLPAYAPHDRTHSTDALVALEVTLAQAELAAARARLAYDAARAELSRAGWAFHDGVVGARIAVKAQFGADSHEVHAVGMTRRSERKRPTRRVKSAVV